MAGASGSGDAPGARGGTSGEGAGGAGGTTAGSGAGGGRDANGGDATNGSSGAQGGDVVNGGSRGDGGSDMGGPAGESGALGGAGTDAGGEHGEGGDAGAAGNGGTGEPPPCGAVKSPESCNGIDDDCDGVADDLGSFSCGVGACKNTVTACVAGAVQACVPLPPQAGPDGCDGIDSDCDGAIDEDCGSCLHVAPDGDDASALANGGATPFSSVQAAIDYADGHDEAPAAVCVAAGATCGSTATYPGPASSDLQMADGIDLLANYESTSFTRCTDSTTRLAPMTASGVVFPASVQHHTVLDGFTIVRPADSGTVSGITVDGARGAFVANVTMTGGASGTTSSYGVDLKNGADATIFHSTIDAGSGRTSAAVRARSSRVAVEDNCDTFDSRGRCTSGCALKGNPTESGEGNSYALVLDDAPGSRVERSALCSLFLVNVSSVLHVSGDALGTVVRASTITSTRAATHGTQALTLEDCGGASPWVVDNPLLAQLNHLGIGGSGTGPTATIWASGDCHPVVESNSEIRGELMPTSGADVIACTDSTGTANRCVITENPNILAIDTGIPGGVTAGSPPVATVVCGGCSRVDHNVIKGFASNACTGQTCYRHTYGLQVTSGSAWVASNRITGGSGLAQRATGVVSNAAAARFENNVIVGQTAGAGARLNNRIGSGTGFTGIGDVHSNFIAGAGGTRVTSYIDSCASDGVDLTSGGTFRNNIITGGSCGVSVVKTTATSYPDSFLHNALYNGPGDTQPNGLLLAQVQPGPYDDYVPVIVAGTLVYTATDFDAIAQMNASGTLDAQCALSSTQHLLAGSTCIDAGTSSGAPLLDMDEQPRDTAPDIGADEFVP